LILAFATPPAIGCGSNGDRGCAIGQYGQCAAPYWYDTTVTPTPSDEVVITTDDLEPIAEPGSGEPDVGDDDAVATGAGSPSPEEEPLAVAPPAREVSASPDFPG